MYNIEHSNTRVRVADWVKAWESMISEYSMSLMALTIPIYMETIKLVKSVAHESAQ
jgi:hypothetical protein